MKLFKGIVIGLSIYFSFHLITGKYGVVAWVKIKDELKTNNLKLQKLTDQKEELEKVVNLLQPGNLNPDLLDEKARAILGYAKKGEKVVILTKN